MPDPETPTAEGILTKLGALLAKHAPPDPDDEPDGDPTGNRASLLARLSKVTGQRNELRAALASLQGDVSTFKTTTETRHTEALKEAKKAAAQEVATLAAQHQEDLALMDLGFGDDLARSALRTAFAKVPEAERPKEGPAKWWPALLEANKADPEKAPIPRTLADYVPRERRAAPREENGGRPAPVPGGLPRIEVGVRGGRQPDAVQAIQGATSFDKLLEIGQGLDRTR